MTSLFDTATVSGLCELRPGRIDPNVAGIAPTGVAIIDPWQPLS